MIIVRNKIRIVDDSMIMDIQVSTVDELPAINKAIDGVTTEKVSACSIAQVVQTGVWYTLDENGTWYDTDGQAASTTSNTSSLASPAVIENGALLGAGKSILTADEPEQIEPETDQQEQTEPDELDTESEVTEDER